MMENPDTWDDLEHSIHEAMQRHAKNEARGIIGPSIVRTIADAVRDYATDQVNEALYEEAMGEDL